MPSDSYSDMQTSLPEGNALPAAGVTLTFPAETPDDNRFQDNYNMMEGENEDTYTLGEKILHYDLGGHICQHHWTAIKAVIVFSAGVTVSKLPPMSKSAKEAKILTVYHDSIN